VEVVPAFNPSGNPIFQQLTQGDKLEEGEYIALWKAYILSLVGNWLLKIYEGHFTPSMVELDKILRGLDLRTNVDAPQSAFQRVIAKLGKLFHWNSAEVECSVSETGMPIIKPRVEFSKDEVEKLDKSRVSIEAVLRLLNKSIEESDMTVWVALDRLDEAFQGYPDVEIPALRALLRTYLDMIEFDRIRLKLFVRRDLFTRITSGGFVNLTHINARKLEIIWDEADLLNLLCRRIRENVEFCEALGIKSANDQVIFDAIFPGQVDFGKRKPATWTWMMRRIRDGNDVKPPRNLIDLVQLAQNAQIRREDREARNLSSRPVLEPDSLRGGLVQLSVTRVNDTLFAEAGSAVDIIEKFKGGKAEHNLASIAELLSLQPDEARTAIKPLIALGFLEVIKDSYKIPSLYREGMSVTQGKAFDAASSYDDEDE
jgi:hypothetical protein